MDRTPAFGGGGLLQLADGGRFYCSGGHHGCAGSALPAGRAAAERVAADAPDFGVHLGGADLPGVVGPFSGSKGRVSGSWVSPDDGMRGGAGGGRHRAFGWLPEWRQLRLLYG